MWMAIATLLIGAAIPIITRRMQSAEDRKARQEIRADAHRDRQRTYLIELQDALGDAQSVLVAAASDRLAGVEPAPSVALIGVRARVEALLARVEDEQTRRLGREFADRAVKMLDAQSRDQLESLSSQIGTAMIAFHDRVEKVLRNLEASG